MLAPDKPLTLAWLTGPSCDGCTIRVIGETTGGGLEHALHTGSIRLIHRALSYETGAAFTDLLEQAARGEFDPYVLVVEASIPEDPPVGFYAIEGPHSIRGWIDRLAPRAWLTIGWGDCGVFGGPHSLEPNPTNAIGIWSYLGVGYRSALGLPVINLPGCAAPPILLRTLDAIVKWSRQEGPPVDLDELNRPRFAYPKDHVLS